MGYAREQSCCGRGGRYANHFYHRSAGRLIRTIGSGYVTFTEVEEHFRELIKAWPPVPRLQVLLDLTECTSLPDFQQLRTIASDIGGYGGQQRFDRCAIVASRELLYGMLRVFEVMSDGNFVAIRVFRAEREAMEWLSTPPLD
jgi:SpoIIAA-like